MTCYHPLKGFIIGTKENGKKDLKIVPYGTECLYKPFGSEIWEKHGFVLDSSIFGSRGRIVTDFIPIPCGQCIGCRLEHSRQWAVRCMLESEYHEENYFITLTYDDAHVPTSEYIDPETGEFGISMTLVMKDVQDFIKRVRRHFDYRDKDGFRYFYCGEYGTKSARPHYHMISFGLHLDDLVLYKVTPYGNYYTSEFLSTKWNKGYVIIGGVSFESCSYVSRYIMKKQKGKGADVYERYNISPEFIRMSRNPAIGKKYFEDNYEDIYPADIIVCSGGKLSSPPRYFDNLMNDLDEELMSNVKQKRKDIAESIQSYKDTLSSADYQTSLQFAERNKKKQLDRLVRPLD